MPLMSLRRDETLSVVIPTLNNPGGVQDILHKLRRQTTEHLIAHVQVVVVDDCGSREASSALKTICSGTEFEKVELVTLARRSGQHGATLCGLRRSVGNIVITLDDDDALLVEDVFAAILELRIGQLDLVMIERKVVNLPAFRRLGSSLINAFNRYLYGLRPSLKTSSCRVMRQELVSEVCKTRSPFPYLNGDLIRLTSKYLTVPSKVSKPQQVSRYRWSSLISSLLRSVWNAYSRLCSLVVRANLFIILVSVTVNLVGFSFEPAGQFLWMLVILDLSVLLGGLGVAVDVSYARPQYGLSDVHEFAK